MVAFHFSGGDYVTYISIQTFYGYYFPHWPFPPANTVSYEIELELERPVYVGSIWREAFSC